MADNATVSVAVTALLTGSGGYVGAEVIRGWRERRTLRLAEGKAPSEIEATISAGARDAVTALRETLAEYRSELAELRAKCEATERELAAERELRRGLEHKVAQLERQLASTGSRRPR